MECGGSAPLSYSQKFESGGAATALHTKPPGVILRREDGAGSPAYGACLVPRQGILCRASPAQDDTNALSGLLPSAICALPSI
jgi:hypothetical protein